MEKIEKDSWDSYLEWSADFEYSKLGIPKPDVVIFLDMPVEISQRLMTERYGGDESEKDVHENNVQFLKNCREAALYAAGTANYICYAGKRNKTKKEYNIRRNASL